MLFLHTFNIFFSERQHLVSSHICEIGKTLNKQGLYLWVLPDPDPCGCTSVTFGVHGGCWKNSPPVIPPDAIYVDKPLVSRNVGKIRRYYGLICQGKTSIGSIIMLLWNKTSSGHRELLYNDECL